MDDFETTVKTVYTVKVDWVAQHEDLSTNTKDAEMHVLHDVHYLYEDIYKKLPKKYVH